ncbi:MAG TPA: ribbon-helix-helix protein, CopG family [Gemmataceae bacterium]|nr:ribbon-helix-helix protein, CopG family [Gemmataceae bacterium]
MKSVRLEPDLEAKLARAARAAAQSQSEFIREALVRRCAEVLGESLAERLAPVVGVIKSAGGRANHTGKAFKQLLARRRKR